MRNGEFIISFDFAENYKFILQNGVQVFHWYTDQATIFTTVIYYVKDSEVKHKSVAIISDNLSHDTVAVYEYQKIILNYLEANSALENVSYVTDGASQYFKTKAISLTS